MKLEVVEDEKTKLKVAVHGESHTLLNLLRENAWVAKADQAAYLIDHPYLSVPEIIVQSDSPKKTLTSAVQLVIDQAKEFEKEFSAAVKK